MTTAALPLAAPLPLTASPSRRFWLTLLLLGLGFFIVEHSLLASRAEDEYYSAEAAALEASASGTWSNRLGFTLLAAVGGWLCFSAATERWRPNRLLLVLAALVLAWVCGSIVWSVEPGQSARRVLALLFCLLAALGVGRSFTAREICQLLLGVTLAYASLGLMAEIALGTFRPWSGAHRFAGTMHPNGQGLACALLCLVSLLLLRDGARGRTRWLLLAALGFGFVLLLLTRSRTALAALLAASAALAMLRPSRQLAVSLLVVAWLTCAGLLVAALAGAEPATRIAGAFAMGRAEDHSTLSGRTELWNELDYYADRRPWLGHGYGGFWSSYHVEAVSGALYWGVSSAHSAYMEAVLGVGLIGFGLLAVLALAALAAAARAYRAAPRLDAALLLVILVFAVAGGVMESDPILPSFTTFVCACAFCRFALFRPAAASARETG
jgi:O-antigen ligase